jgi:hypothetical protein
MGSRSSGGKKGLALAVADVTSKVRSQKFLYSLPRMGERTKLKILPPRLLPHLAADSQEPLGDS